MRTIAVPIPPLLLLKSLFHLLDLYEALSSIWHPNNSCADADRRSPREHSPLHHKISLSHEVNTLFFALPVRTTPASLTGSVKQGEGSSVDCIGW